MPTFAIDSATAEVSRERRGRQVRETRTLALEGPSANGGRNRARLWFAPAVTRGPVVGYMVTADPDGVSLVGWLPLEAFAAYRDVIEAGGLLEIHYETRGASSGYLRRLALGRGRAAAAAPRKRQRREPEGTPAELALPL